MRSEKTNIYPSSEGSISSTEFDAFRVYLESQTGIVLSDNKGYLVASRLNRLMCDQKIASFSELIIRIKQESNLAKFVIDAMTTNETSWFRDNYPYDILQQKLLPDLVKSKPSRIRIWSSACATGQEPYSIRMVTDEYLQKNLGVYSRENIEVIGTDISSAALDMAKLGIYDSAMAGRGLLADRKKRFFSLKDNQWHVKDDIKNSVSFRELNLKQSYASLGKFDIIFCRNVMIYFSSHLKSEVLAKMAASLNPGGYLMVGGSESVSGYCDSFELISWKSGVVYQLKQAG